MEIQGISEDQNLNIQTISQCGHTAFWGVASHLRTGIMQRPQGQIVLLKQIIKVVIKAFLALAVTVSLALSYITTHRLNIWRNH